jgi:hypothetical protein
MQGSKPPDSRRKGRQYFLFRYIYGILTVQLSFDNQKIWPRMPKKQDLCRHIGKNRFQGQSSHPLSYTARERAEHHLPSG